jgi:hypothetical protein
MRSSLFCLCLAITIVSTPLQAKVVKKHRQASKKQVIHKRPQPKRGFKFEGDINYLMPALQVPDEIIRLADRTFVKHGGKLKDVSRWVRYDTDKNFVIEYFEAHDGPPPIGGGGATIVVSKKTHKIVSVRGWM